jgi:regulator of sigma E protease
MLKSKPWLECLGNFSMTFGVLNMLPLPLWNGGHIVIVLIETATGRRVSDRVIEFGARLTLLMVLAVWALLILGLGHFLISG